jgi:hypothetical protein
MDRMAHGLIVATERLGDAPGLLTTGTGQHNVAATSDAGIGHPSPS